MSQATTNPGHLLLRADASSAIGTGHVMRCLALAQAWQDAGGRATFASAELPDALAKRLRAEGIETTHIEATAASSDDSASTVAIARAKRAQWTVVDGYRFTPGYLGDLRAGGVRILAVDDLAHLERYPVDYLLNQNLGARGERYAGKLASGQMLLGTQYALLRREFGAGPGDPRSFASAATKVLVTFGGSDPDNVTAKAIAALELLRNPALEARVVVGGCNEHLAALGTMISRSPCSIRLERDVRNMPELMAWADLAVTAGGSTSWEMARMGLPALMLVLSTDQEGVAASLERLGVVKNLGWAHRVAPAALAPAIDALLRDGALRRQMSEAGRHLVDGRGSHRIVEILRRESP